MLTRFRPALCSCGETLQFQGEIASVKCDKCGNTMQREGATLAQQSLAEKFPTPSLLGTPLTIGMKASINGRQYEIIGRQVLSTIEEGETYTWNEFELVTVNDEILFLEYDDGQWKLMEPFSPRTPLTPQDADRLREGDKINLGDYQGTVSTYGFEKWECVEGELSYDIDIGETAKFLDSGDKRLISIEWTENEIEFYEGTYITERQVLTAFGLRQELAALDNAVGGEKSKKVFGIICLFLSLAALFMWWMPPVEGTSVARGEAPIASITQEGVRFGPYTLDPSMHVHSLTISGNMTQASAWVAAVLEAADGKELITSQHDLWDESGTDSDGAWHESTLTGTTYFNIKNSGPYYIRIYAERDNPPQSYGTVGYELKGGVLYPQYFLIYSIVFFLISLIFFRDWYMWMFRKTDDD